MFTMWINFFVTAVTVTAIKVDPNNIRDHALAQSKTDFSSFRDEHFDGTDSDGDGGRSAERHASPEFDHREFNKFTGLLGLNFGDYYGGGDSSLGSVFNNQEFNRNSGVNSVQSDMENSIKQSSSKTKDHGISDTFESDTQKTIQQIQQFVYQNSRPGSSERLTENHNQLLNIRDEDKELPTTKYKRKVSNTESSEVVKQNSTKSHQNNKPKIDVTNKGLPVNDRNIEATTLIPSVTTDMSYNDVTDDQRPWFKATTNSKVLPAVRTGTEGRVSPEEEDRWIWSDGGGTENPPSKTRSSSTSDVSGLDDRTAFNGDKCPTGKKRFGGVCVEVD